MGQLGFELIQDGKSMRVDVTPIKQWGFMEPGCLGQGLPTIVKVK